MSQLAIRLPFLIVLITISFSFNLLHAEEASLSEEDLAELITENKNEARERMREDTKEYSREELREIEALYQVANKNWRTPEAKESLEELVKEYKKANRTGCALLYLAQYSEGEERENYLTQVVEDYSDCYYGNGCIVGGYARYLLALYYLENDGEDEATDLFDEIEKKFDTATGHRGQLIVDLVTKVKAEQQ